MAEYKISSRLTFSNSLLKKEHLSDKKCNELCELLKAAIKKQHTYSGINNTSINTACKTDGVKNGIIRNCSVMHWSSITTRFDIRVIQNEHPVRDLPTSLEYR